MIKLVKSSFYKEEETKKALVDFIMDAQQLSMGEQCRMFEEAFAKKQERKYAVFVSSGSVADLLLIQGLLNTGRLKKGDRVGFSALTWATNVMPLIQLGLVPVPLDCNPKTLNVSPEILAKEADSLQCLLLTNVLGFSDDIAEIEKICREKNIIFLEDNCESLGSKVQGRLLGNFGLASTFSFFVGHHLSTIEGGMICTDDQELHKALVIARAHGWDRNLAPEDQAKLRAENNIDDFYARYTFYDLAYNVRPNEINGFLGNKQLGYWDELVAKRRENFAKFYEALVSNDDFVKYDFYHMELVSNFAVPVVCKDKNTAAKYKTRFSEAGVEIRPVIAGNITRQPFYTKYVKAGDYPNSDLVHTNGFYFGNNAELTTEEVDTLCRLLAK